jgi:hypothetical protein
MKKSITKLIKNEALYKITPSFVKSIARSVLPSYKFDREIWAKDNPYVGTDKEWKYKSTSDITLGILYDFSHSHANYMQACIEEGISYKVIDITSNNWIENIKQSGCTIFLVWPSVYNHAWKNMFDNRLRFMKEDMGLTIYPQLKELWMYESKLRVIEWLKVKKYAAPQSWIFYKEEEANDFVSKCDLPIVFKTDLGAGSNGVLIIRKRDELKTLIKDCFGMGFKAKRGDPRDKQWGYIIFQEYLEDAEEWRMVRVGDSYFCRQKGKVGDFHSGVGKMFWGEAPEILLNSIRDITDKEGFSSMNIDFFYTKDGRFVINELHPVFGAILQKNLNMEDPLMGRYKFENNNWVFEHGYFYNNACANLRVKYVVEKIRTNSII